MSPVPIVLASVSKIARMMLPPLDASAMPHPMTGFGHAADAAAQDIATVLVKLPSDAGTGGEPNAPAIEMRAYALPEGGLTEPLPSGRGIVVNNMPYGVTLLNTEVSPTHHRSTFFCA